MCIKALDLDVDLIKLDMYQKYEHKKPWFVKVNDHLFVLESLKPKPNIRLVQDNISLSF